jgi:hypothetical protein
VRWPLHEGGKTLLTQQVNYSFFFTIKFLLLFEIIKANNIMFKKYGIGLLAVILAISFSAFKTIKHHPLVDKYVFEYNPGSPADYTKTRVEITGNWSYVGLNQAPCTGTQTKACRVAVIGSYVNSTTSPSALAGVTLTAVETAGIAKVTAINDGVNNSFSNKP